MLADPAVITINAVAKNLVRIRQDNYSAEYLLRSSTEEHRFNVRNTTGVNRKTGIKTDRHNAELIHTVFATSTTPDIVRKSYVVIENQQGDTLVDPTYVAAGLMSFLTASSNANITKLMNFES